MLQIRGEQDSKSGFLNSSHDLGTSEDSNRRVMNSHRGKQTDYAVPNSYFKANDRKDHSADSGQRNAPISSPAKRKNDRQAERIVERNPENL
mmetsp:Transcript_20569/g.43202  ORF Transcript_20569/g.43202 Transcript_20569/m.43202 type:complete len:92 (+) Transcript_20569:615-890(+)